MRMKWLGVVFASVLVLWASPVEAQCNFCEPCNDNGIKTCDLCITPFLVLYVALPSCYTYPQGCGHLIDCPEEEQEELDEMIANLDWPGMYEYGKARPGTFELVEKRGVLLVRDQCARQVIAVLEVPKEEVHLFLSSTAPIPPE